MFKKGIIFLIASFCFSIATMAQTGTVSGKITNAEGTPAASATVTIADKNIKTVADEAGNYQIKDLPYGKYELEVSYLGDNSFIKFFTLNQPSLEINAVLNALVRTIDEVKITGVKSVIATKSEYVSKMPLSNLENSQVYTGITSTLITQQKIYNLDDVVRNAPGINKSSDGWPGSVMWGTSYVSRGFGVSIKALDGLANNIVMPSDVQNVSKIEVIKGPSATLFGGIISSYGGLINRITKKPYEEMGIAVDLSAGTFNFQRLGIDANLPANKDKTFLTRMNVALSNQGNFMDNGGYSKSILFAPSFTYKMSDNVKIDLSSEIYNTQVAGMPMGVMFTLLPSAVKQYTAQILGGMGLPEQNINAIVSQMPSTVKEAFGTENVNKLGLDRFRSYMDKNMGSVTKSLNVHGNVQYIISPRWTSNTSAIFTSGSDDGYEGRFILLPNVVPALLNSLPTGNISFGTAGADYLGRNSRKFESTLSTHQVQQNFVGDYKIGNMRNRMVLGLDYYFHYSNASWRNFMGTLFTVPYEGFFDVIPIKGNAPNYYDFEKNRVDELLATKQISQTSYGSKNTVYSAYINDVLNITPALLVNAGVRVDRFVNKGSYDGRENEWAGGFNQNAVSPKFGIVYQPVLDKLSLFANYQTGFSNVAGVSRDNKPFKPEKSFQWEAGLKYALFNGNFTGTLSYYDITVNDIVRMNPNDIFFSIQDGQQVSRGFEAEVLGKPLPNFNIMLGYAYNHSRYLRADESVNGLRPITSGPYNQANVWLHYHFVNSGLLNNFSIGAGGNYVGQTFAMIQKPDGGFIVPDYTLVNAKLSYDRNNYSFAVRVNNLLDENIWTGSSSIRPQMPRQFIGSIAVKF